MTKNCPHPRRYVDPKETISRFVYDSSYIKNGVKQTVFRVDSDNTVSVFRITDRSPEYIWNLCDNHARTNQRAVGRAEFQAKAVTDLGLSFDPDGKPHTRHVAIVGWNPNKDSELDRRKELARLSTPFMRPA